jgi:hypothetical protein
MQGKVGNNVGGGGIGQEGRYVEGARVRGKHLCSIWEAGDDGRGGWENIVDRGVSSWKVAGGARVKDGLSPDGVGSGVDCL